jgi:hypothetical protein
VSIQTVLDGICQYFGGPYDPTTRTYRSPTVPGVGVVRRAWAKRDEHEDYFQGLPAASRTGCQIVVHIPSDRETRKAVGGATSGIKRDAFIVELHCYIRSRTPHAEEAQDDVYALRDALKARLRQDRTLGGAVFQAGEAIDGEHSWIEFEYGQPETRNELTKSYLLMRFGATEYLQA